ncbi:LysR family transcriptional regulator [Burkholderia sp. Bp9012]|uniref:LysR family transcriptional regulator n=1 Tax=Burkholderia sp. Bp9012 TaxID=2184562 RepID=UPI0016257389|nr:LysR family transcriptional regulator [Burkholderia sp. Bp9012]
MDRQVDTRRNPSNRLEHLRVQHLRLLDLIEQRGSLSAAARELHLSQPAVSKMLQDLEAAIGVPLVQRAGRGGTLTKAGVIALQRLRLSMSWLDAAALEAAAPRAMPTIRLGVLPWVAFSVLGEVVARVLSQPDAPILHVYEDTVQGLLDALVAGEIDCVVSTLNSTRKSGETFRNLAAIPLHEAHLSLACAVGHPLTQKSTLSITDLEGQEWVLGHPLLRTRSVVDELFHVNGLPPPEPRVESSSFHTSLRIVSATSMLTFAPQSAVRHYHRLGLVHELKLEDSLGSYPLLFVTQPEALSVPAIAALLDAFRAVPEELGKCF